MSTVEKGDLLIYPDCEAAAGFRRARVDLVIGGVVYATGHDGETFELSRSELETQGFAANGSAYDPIFTLEGYQAYADLSLQALREQIAVERGLGVN